MSSWKPGPFFEVARHQATGSPSRRPAHIAAIPRRSGAGSCNSHCRHGQSAPTGGPSGGWPRTVPGSSRPAAAGHPGLGCEQRDPGSPERPAARPGAAGGCRPRRSAGTGTGGPAAGRRSAAIAWSAWTRARTRCQHRVDGQRRRHRRSISTGKSMKWADSLSSWPPGPQRARMRRDPEATAPSRKTSRRSRPHPAVLAPRRGWPAGPPAGPPAPGASPADARPLGRTRPR
jgi:hypothetical protein